MTAPQSYALWTRMFAVLSALLDASIVAVSLALGYMVNFNGFDLHGFISHQWKLILFSVVLFVGLNAILGVYRQAYVSSLRAQIGAALKSYTLGTLMIFATLFLFRNTYYSNGALFTYLVLVPGTFISGRIVLDLVRKTLLRKQLGLQSAIVIQLDGVSGNPIPGFDVKSVLDVRSTDGTETQRLVKDTHSETGAYNFIYRCSTIALPQLPPLVDGARQAGITQRLVTPEIHDTLSRLRLYDLGGIILSDSPLLAHRSVYTVTKRMFDILVSSVLIVLAAPLLASIALAIVLESRGGVFFRQTRSLSRNSPPVRVLKFRSMHVNGVGPGASANLSMNGGEAVFKSPSDPRVTRVGRVIRKYSMDELPQLFNVLSGEMSLVGPRPLPASDFRGIVDGTMIASLYERRSSVQPGLTGLWQISGRSGLNLQQMVILDLYYAEHRSFLFDLEILLETIPAVISGRGAY